MALEPYEVLTEVTSDLTIFPERHPRIIEASWQDDLFRHIGLDPHKVLY